METTYAMHQEFHGAEMTKSRGLAGETVREHKAKNYDELRRDLPLEKTQHVWNVLYFYQRLWFAIKYENIQKNKVPVMFGENFWWWRWLMHCAGSKRYHTSLMGLADRQRDQMSTSLSGMFQRPVLPAGTQIGRPVGLSASDCDSP